jgi:hypothetical protein
MRLLRGNKRRAVSRGGEGGRVEHAGQAPGGEQYDENKPKEPAPSQVAVMFDRLLIRQSNYGQSQASLMWIKTTVQGEIGDA